MELQGILATIGIADAETFRYDQRLLESINVPTIIDSGVLVSVGEFAEILRRLSVDLSGASSN